MRTLTLAAMIVVASLAVSTIAAAVDVAGVSGVLVYKHQVTIADTSMDPAATTVGQFFHDFPRGAPGRLPMVPTKEAVTLRVRKDNGEKVEVMQDLDDSKNLSVGDRVFIEQVEGKDRVVTAK
jgi:hypothetical protein